MFFYVILRSETMRTGWKLSHFQFPKAIGRDGNEWSDVESWAVGSVSREITTLIDQVAVTKELQRKARLIAQYFSPFIIRFSFLFGTFISPILFHNLLLASNFSLFALHTLPFLHTSTLICLIDVSRFFHSSTDFFFLTSLACRLVCLNLIEK